MSFAAQLSEIVDGVGLDGAQAARAVGLTGEAEAELPSRFRIGHAARLSLGAVGAGIALHARAAGGEEPAIAIDGRDALAECLSERLMRVDGNPPPDPWDPLAGAYAAGEGGHIRIHTNFPHHREAALSLFGCALDREALAAAALIRPAEAWEAEAPAHGALVFAVRYADRWNASEQGRSVASERLISLDRVGDAAPRPLSKGMADKPLAGLRVLDLTRIIAGPVAGRDLAAHGADVLLVTGPHLPSIPSLVMDTGRGKRACALDLRAEADRETMRALIGGADVVIRSYRPGALDRLGFGVEDMAALRPGLVTVSLNAWGWSGPWAGRRGFDSLVQAASGFNWAEAAAFGDQAPRALPAQILDHATGHLAAFAALAGRIRQAREGGSWHARLSLARTAHWLRALGERPEQDWRAGLTPPDFASSLEEVESGFGRLCAPRHALCLDGRPTGWDRPAMPLGSHPPRW